jgi:hypothetical protein
MGYRDRDRAGLHVTTLKGLLSAMRRPCLSVGTEKAGTLETPRAGIFFGLFNAGEIVGCPQIFTHEFHRPEPLLVRGLKSITVSLVWLLRREKHRNTVTSNIRIKTIFPTPKRGRDQVTSCGLSQSISIYVAGELSEFCGKRAGRIGGTEGVVGVLRPETQGALPTGQDGGRGSGRPGMSWVTLLGLLGLLNALLRSVGPLDTWTLG